MKTIQSKAGELILVPVPKEAQETGVGIVNTGEDGFDYLNGNKIYYTTIGKYFPSAILIGLLSELTEEQAKELVHTEVGENLGNLTLLYTDYNEQAGTHLYGSAKESLQSLIESSGIVLTENEDCLILLKKEK